MCLLESNSFYDCWHKTRITDISIQMFQFFMSSPLTGNISYLWPFSSQDGEIRAACSLLHAGRKIKKSGTIQSSALEKKIGTVP